MSLSQIQTAIEGKLATAGFSCAAGVINLTVPLKDLPAATAYFAGFVEEEVETDTATLTARFRVDALFSLADAAQFRTDILTKVPAIWSGIRGDRSLGGLVDRATVEDGGPPEFVEAAVPLAVKTQFVVVEYEEDA
ncbi:MAG TPA: hypothetical protein VIK83_03385 [Coriobacteriia bacterium]